MTKATLFLEKTKTRQPEYLEPAPSQSLRHRIHFGGFVVSAPEQLTERRGRSGLVGSTHSDLKTVLHGHKSP